MRYGYVAFVIVIAQVGLAVLAIVLEYAMRSRRRSAAACPQSAAINASARRLLSKDISAAEAVSGLRSASGNDTAEALVRMGMDRVRPGEKDQLAELLQSEPWVRASLSGAGSRLWWKRLAAARMLALIASEANRETIFSLLSDNHAAVQLAATSCLCRYADQELLTRVIDGLATASSAVRSYQIGVLRLYPGLVWPMLNDRIRADAAPHRLYAYIHAAAELNDPACMARVADLSTHPHPEVRVAVARVLKSDSGDSSHVKLMSLLRDPDWRVRAQAARGLAGTTDARTVEELGRALTDSNWWVRFRAGLALAGTGAKGHAELEEALAHTDRYARDMAMLVIGLSDASVAELSEG